MATFLTELTEPIIEEGRESAPHTPVPKQRGQAQPPAGKAAGVTLSPQFLAQWQPKPVPAPVRRSRPVLRTRNMTAGIMVLPPLVQNPHNQPGFAYSDF